MLMAVTANFIAGNGSRLCEGKGLEALNFKYNTND